VYRTTVRWREGLQTHIIPVIRPLFTGKHGNQEFYEYLAGKKK